MLKKLVNKMAFLRYPKAVKAAATMMAAQIIGASLYTIISLACAIIGGAEAVGGAIGVGGVITISYLLVFAGVANSIGSGYGYEEIASAFELQLKLSIAYMLLVTFGAFWVGSLLHHGLIGFLVMGGVTAFLLFAVVAYVVLRLGLSWLSEQAKEG